MTNTNNTAELPTNTENIPVGTRVTRIGSDRYAATVVKSTKRTCEIKYDSAYLDNKTFRLTTADATHYTHREHHRITVIGEGTTEMCREH